MLNSKNLRNQIKQICSRTLEGNIDLKEFVNIWPSDAAQSVLLNLIYEDLEDAIEHMPGYWFKRGVNLKLWVRSPAFMVVHLDYLLLDYDKTDEELIKCKEYVFGLGLSAEELQEKAIMKHFGDEKIE